MTVSYGLAIVNGLDGYMASSCLTPTLKKDLKMAGVHVHPLTFFSDQEIQASVQMMGIVKTILNILPQKL